MLDLLDLSYELRWLFWYCVPAAVQLQEPLLWGDETEFITGSLLAIA